ncbi:MAG: hypothetical protein ACR2OH_07400 [Microthrixaceae bacterium]
MRAQNPQDQIVGPDSVFLPGSDQFILASSLVLLVVALLVAIASLWLRRRRRKRDKPKRRPVGFVASAVMVAIALIAGILAWPPPFSVPEFPALPRLFDDNAFFYREVGDLQVAENSSAAVEALGGLPLIAYASAEVGSGKVAGKPFNFVDDSTQRYAVSFSFPAGSDEGEYPISDPAYIQSMPLFGTDEHYIGIDVTGGRMWEMWAIRNWFGDWHAGSGAIWDLDSLQYPKGRTTASGFPMQPMSFTWEQVRSGQVDHAIFAGSPVVGPEAIWPARASDGPSEDPDAPPMGTWFRLRADVELTQLGPQARVIAEAMRTHGVVLGDTGGNFSLSGTPDARWDDDDLDTLKTLSTDDFEVLDTSELMVREGSMEVRQPDGTGVGEQ